MLAVLAVPSPSAACSFIPIVRYELTPEESAGRLSECLQVFDTRYEFLEQVQRGERDVSEAMAFSSTLSNGYDGCPSDSLMSLRILDEAVGAPLSYDINASVLWALKRHVVENPDGVSRERAREIIARYWLTQNIAPHEYAGIWTHEELDEYIQIPRHWEIATEYLRRGGSGLGLQNADRNRAIFKHASDRGSPYYDPNIAFTIADYTETRADDLFLAHGLISNSPSEVELRMAARLLDQGQQEADPSGVVSSEIFEQNAGYLAYLLRQSDNHGLHRLAVQFDGQPANEPVPGFRGAVAIGGWQEFFPEFGLAYERIMPRLAANYPMRALRREQTGVTETALLFGPDGTFQKVWITGSSMSEFLDEGVVRDYTRYVRPRLSSLTLPEEFHGQYSLVAMPPVERRIDANWSQDMQRWRGDFVDGRFVLTARMPRRTGGC